jgi:hypothetical protein
MYRLNVYIQEGIYQPYTTRNLYEYTESYKKGHIHDVKQMYDVSMCMYN